MDNKIINILAILDSYHDFTDINMSKYKISEKSPSPILSAFVSPIIFISKPIESKNIIKPMKLLNNYL